MSSLGSLAVNVVSLCTSTWGLWRASNIILPECLASAGHKQFLTNISVGVTILNNLVNVLGALGLRKARYVSRQVTLPIALVMETVVAIVYWPLRLFAVGLIMHGVKDGSRMPISKEIDCCIHLLPVLYLLIDYFAFEPAPFKMGKGRAWLVVTVLGLGYNRYLTKLIDPSRGQAYPYPFLDVAEPLKSVIFMGVTTLAWLFYCMYKKVHKAEPAAMEHGKKD
ncbi:LAFE_0H04170g1_1 [Lachancea fermentati]|uniref:LAFE_0H04170g1_1 n=1 Tax=Lachancea fermentati TaxID=4955 RepID=A0A1G4MJL5_LACFM|nr:LAFE_0H04170g1_1 [Lachancea fermentati]